MQWMHGKRVPTTDGRPMCGVGSLCDISSSAPHVILRVRREEAVMADGNAWSNLNPMKFPNTEPLTRQSLKAMYERMLYAADGYCVDCGAPPGRMRLVRRWLTVDAYKNVGVGVDHDHEPWCPRGE